MHSELELELEFGICDCHFLYVGCLNGSLGCLIFVCFDSALFEMMISAIVLDALVSDQ